MSNRGEQGDGIYSPNAAAAGSLDFAVTASDKIRHYTALVSEKLSKKVHRCLREAVTQIRSLGSVPMHPVSTRRMHASARSVLLVLIGMCTELGTLGIARYALFALPLLRCRL
jgi:hypothetical protein